VATPALLRELELSRLSSASTATHNAFTQAGANSLNLNVAQQTTSSLRSVVGAEPESSIGLGWREPLGVQLRLGWSHEFADT
jgi:subtilase-type serine protease